MILSIYFDLPMVEIKAVHERCYQFLCKIDDERRNEALMIAAATGEAGPIPHDITAEESKYDGDLHDDEDTDRDPKYTKRQESSRQTNRRLVDGHSGMKFNKKGGGI